MKGESASVSHSLVFEVTFFILLRQDSHSGKYDF
jgi:hypothetical protein